jgi:hypothetical protein
VNEDGTVYKIGYSKRSVTKRIEACQTGNPYPIKEVYRYSTKHGRQLETALHNFFSHYRMEGEWFKLDWNVVVNFMSMCEKIEKNLDLLKKNEIKS